ncbi:MAG: beta-eliminating lyase-related protein [Pseudomonadota bacterium]
MFFSSDNAGPAAPEVLAALAEANEGYAPPYGADDLMTEVRDRLRQIFEAPEAAVYLVGTGTAANSLALACLNPPWATIYCHSHAHVEADECAAPEFFTGGAKLTLIDGPDGKLLPDPLHARLAATMEGFVHSVQRGTITISNLTESGAAYTPAEVAALGAVAREFGVALHMDGARFANAIVGTNASPADMTWRAGVDALSFGGTKNGLMGVEAVLLFDPAKAWEFELRRKRAAHLFSKHRYLSAQMAAYLRDDLWKRLAGQANAAARRLAEGIEAIEGAHLLHPVGGNQVFAAWPRGGHRRAQEAGAYYYLWPMTETMEGPDEEPVSARLVCNWATEAAAVERFLELIRE